MKNYPRTQYFTLEELKYILYECDMNLMMKDIAIYGEWSTTYKHWKTEATNSQTMAVRYKIRKDDINSYELTTSIIEEK